MKLKKIGEIWASDSTADKHFNDIIVTDLNKVNIENWECVLKKASGIKYNVFGYNKNAYDELIFRIKH